MAVRARLAGGLADARGRLDPCQRRFADSHARPATVVAYAGDASAALHAVVGAALRVPGRAGEEARFNLGLGKGNTRTLEFARELRAQYPDDGGYIRAVLTKFNREEFVYTLAPPFMEHDPVDMFLFDARRGFCEHYASAFVLLLRAAGIPARVVTGYQGGMMNPRGSYMIVRQSDAHAWAEAMIDGHWQRFDPTAAVAPSRIEIGLGGALPASDMVPFLRAST